MSATDAGFIRRLEGHLLVSVVPIALVVVWLVGMEFKVDLGGALAVYLVVLGAYQMPAYMERRRVREAVRLSRRLRRPPPVEVRPR